MSRVFRRILVLATAKLLSGGKCVAIINTLLADQPMAHHEFKCHFLDSQAPDPFWRLQFESGVRITTIDASLAVEFFCSRFRSATKQMSSVLNEWLPWLPKASFLHPFNTSVKIRAMSFVLGCTTWNRCA